MRAAVLSRRASPPPGLPVPLARVLAELTEGLAPIPARRVPLSEAEGAILATPLVVPSPVPSQALALRRGYAVSSADTLGAGPYSPAPLPFVPPILEVGQALPDGADALLPEDAVLVADGIAEAQESAFPGLWARRRGEDAPADAMLRQAGEVLRGLDLAVAEAAGISACEIRRPRILWGGTDSVAGSLVTALASSAGAADADSIDDADFVFAIGDVAAHFERYLGQRARVLARRLALRPGEDGAALRLDDVPILLAPDRVADALGLWFGLGLPIVRALTGASAHPREERSLSRKISSTIGVAELALLRAAGRGFDPLAVGDLPLAAIARADAWAMVPPESEGLAAGEAIEAELLGS